MFAKIVVGVDGSNRAEKALRLACDLATKYGSEVHIVHTPRAETVAFALGPVTGQHLSTSKPEPEALRNAAEKVLSSAQAIAREQGLSAARHVGDGDPADDMIRIARERGAGLIVTGRRGLGNLTGALLGSTSQRVSKHAECAHLTVF